jgi:hypothetical protein
MRCNRVKGAARTANGDPSLALRALILASQVEAPGVLAEDRVGGRDARATLQLQDVGQAAKSMRPTPPSVRRYLKRAPPTARPRPAKAVDEPPTVADAPGCPVVLGHLLLHPATQVIVHELELFVAVGRRVRVAALGAAQPILGVPGVREVGVGLQVAVVELAPKTVAVPSYPPPLRATRTPGTCPKHWS